MFVSVSFLCDCMFYLRLALDVVSVFFSTFSTVTNPVSAALFFFFFGAAPFWGFVLHAELLVSVSARASNLCVEHSFLFASKKHNLRKKNSTESTCIYCVSAARESIKAMGKSTSVRAVLCLLANRYTGVQNLGCARHPCSKQKQSYLTSNRRGLYVFELQVSARKGNRGWQMHKKQLSIKGSLHMTRRNISLLSPSFWTAFSRMAFNTGCCHTVASASRRPQLSKGASQRYSFNTHN